MIRGLSLKVLQRFLFEQGNIQFRILVKKFKKEYNEASKFEKSFIASEVVEIWRKQEPPGRFLAKTDPSLGEDR
jgi:hypothetical protein